MNKKFYANLEDDGENVVSTFKDKLEFLTREVGANNKVLEVGCNDGYVGSIFLQGNNDVYGIDIVKEKLVLAQKRGLKVKECDIENEQFPYPQDYFDVVILGDVIEHVFDTDSLMEKCKRVLKKDGKLIITTPNVASLGRRIMLLLGMNPFLEFSSKFPPVEGYPAVGHIRYYTLSTLCFQLDHHGFKDISIQGGTIISFPMLFKFIYLFRNFASFFPHLMCTARK